jgi:hypothetical protein
MHLVRVAGLAYQQKKLPSEIEAEDNRNIEALEIVINTIKAKERSQQNHG